MGPFAMMIILENVIILAYATLCCEGYDEICNPKRGDREGCRPSLEVAEGREHDFIRASSNSYPETISSSVVDIYEPRKTML